ncbi:MAG: hypothetical protein CL908_00770 [Deltaproteobacteria bacterium]|nr:hypothetical protein [Deltaproteobacteria bacterium]
MSDFPQQPVSPREFVEEVVPALFADVRLDEAERGIDLRIGLVLRGDEGGEWTLHFVAGELGIASGRHHDAELTVVQRVEDWRTALWEGRPGLVADAVARVAESGPEALRPSVAPRGGAEGDPLRGVSDLRGLIELIISERGGEEWRIAVLLGPGAIPETPQATILLGAEQAEAIRSGDLHPLEALITGQLRLEGDLGLILQLQALAMNASMSRSAPRRGS